jgi:hypothetical protein
MKSTTHGSPVAHQMGPTSNTRTSPFTRTHTHPHTRARNRSHANRFEVSILNNSKLIHSKLAGKGRCETAEEKQEVIDAIQEYIDNA